MKKPLVTRNDIAEAIALHTACMPTREIPGAIANRTQPAMSSSA